MANTDYFPVLGDWTEAVLRMCNEHAEASGIRDVVVASTTGETGVKATDVLKGLNVVVVTHSAGFREQGKLELLDGNRRSIEEKGGKVLVATHSLSGVESAFRKKFSTIGPVELIANAFRIFGEGTKVCIEIALMAADAGLIPTDRDILCVAGTSRGADTALIIRPANSANVFDVKVRRYLCKPFEF